MNRNLTKLITSEDYAYKLKLLHERWEAHKMQERVLKAIFSPPYYKRVFIRAGRKGGKSETVMYVPLRLAGLFPNMATAIIGPSLKQQKKIMWNNGKLINFLPQEFNPTVRKSDTSILFTHHNSYVELDGSENYEAHRGTEYDVLVLDELKDHDRRFYDATYPNLAARDGILIVIGTPPKTRDNFYYQLETEAINDPDWYCIHWTSWDNPHISKEWLKKEKEKYYRRGDADIWEREYEARYVFGGKDSVFPMFSQTRHVRDHDVLEAFIERDKHRLDWYVIADPATTSTFGVLFIAYNKHNGQIYVLDEIYEKNRNLTTSSIMWGTIKDRQERLYPGYTGWQYIYDEAAAWFANEIAVNYAVGWLPTQKSLKDKEVDISSLKDVMSAENLFFVSHRCKWCVWELENYITDDLGRFVKKHDHLIDCLRYFMDASSYSLNFAANRPTVGGERRFYTPDQDMRLHGLQTDALSVLESDLMIDDFEGWM